MNDTIPSPAALFSLQERCAVVIGGTGELCGTMAEGLAAAGARVLIAGRNPEKAEVRVNRIREQGGTAVFAACDLSSRRGLEDLLQTAIREFGRIEILINGAGVNSPTPFLDISEEELDRILQVNTRAVFFACQVFGAYFLRESIRASIINVGSLSGLVPLSRVFTYSMSKAAVHNLSRNLGREWAPHGIRVNTLVPGFFPAEQNRRVLTEDRVQRIMSHTPMQRFGNASELVGATLLLASERAGSFITGCELVVDGGFSAMTI